MALVELFEKNHLKYVVSQNVDGLHRKSGIPAANLSELHGNTNLEICEECGREYMRDTRVRNAQKVKEHRTGRKCESTGCNGFLKDTIINFGEPLNSTFLNLGEHNCMTADVCLSMGSSLRVSPANTFPEQCALNGGQLVICNLQTTPLDHLATLVIHAKCDDVMELLMKKLNYQIPAWQMKKRLEVSLVEDGARVSLRGVDDRNLPFHLFKQVKVTGTTRQETVANTKKVYPAENGPNAKQPYKFALPAADARTQSFQVNLNFMGNYNEKSLNLKVSMDELMQHQTIVYEMVMDAQSGSWEICVARNSDSEVLGVAEFTQR